MLKVASNMADPIGIKGLRQVALIPQIRFDFPFQIIQVSFWLVYSAAYLRSLSLSYLFGVFKGSKYKFYE